MINIENTIEYNEFRQKILGGRVTSIWKSDSFFKGAKSYPIVNFNYLTSEFSDFEKNIFEKNQKMIYHLSGYGTTYNEAVASFLGESVERYSFASFYSIIKNYVIKDSYKSLVNKYGEDKVCNLKYINSYFSDKDEKYYVNENDELQWIALNSLIELGEKVYIPLQFIVSNNGTIFENEKPFMTSAVSTGTACHEDIIKSFENAAIEYLQIDSFNLWWYGGIKGKDIKVNLEEFLHEYFKDKKEVKQFLENFSVNFTDISYDKNIDIIVCEVFGQKEGLPKYTVGVQGGKGMKKVLYRGFMECIAVLEYNMNLPWMDINKYESITKKSTKINNLDDNVIMYSKYGKPSIVKHDYDFYKGINVSKNYNLIECIKKYSKYAGFLRITLPEFEGLNLEVVRVSVPEILPLCLPSYPPYFHERYKKIGGIRNNVPHPLA
ncbi:YcaO-like family protein [Clostridium sp. MSJ-8]|uniref:YcaO-like family protein n=1 Tax=Clostridium sp. MSJ-8 TaxID=2841510 RepID=UPI001C0E9966|nr:YcaO-like family protein [Clostridium sp. MSJ-8]MBU5487321.1 YcaO-like family protein [Clostridium sp. MSJ-8]